VEARVLDGERRVAAVAQHPGEQRDALAGARAHHDALRVGRGGARPPEIRGERLAQLGGAARVGVAELGVGDAPQRPPPRRHAAAHAWRGNDARSGLPASTSCGDTPPTARDGRARGTDAARYSPTRVTPPRRATR